jgi:hypothetical protein
LLLCLVHLHVYANFDLFSFDYALVSHLPATPSLPGILCLFVSTRNLLVWTFSTVEPIRTGRPPRPRYPMTAKEPMVSLRYLHDFQFFQILFLPIFSIPAL